MKQYISRIMILCLLLVGCYSVCWAEIPRSELTLGGINLGATPEYVKSVYGEPTRYESNGHGDVIYNYNNTFRILFVDGKYMYWIETTADNGIKTPSGVGVGMDASILSKYGATYYEKDENGVHYKAYWAKYRVVLICGIHNGKIVSLKASV